MVGSSSGLMHCGEYKINDPLKLNAKLKVSKGKRNALKISALKGV